MVEVAFKAIVVNITVQPLCTRHLGRNDPFVSIDGWGHLAMASNGTVSRVSAPGAMLNVCQ